MEAPMVYLVNLHAHMSATGRKRNAKELREIMKIIIERDELRQRVAMMEMNADMPSRTAS